MMRPHLPHCAALAAGLLSGAAACLLLRAGVRAMVTVAGWVR
jgi:hypothetical protein